MSERLSQTTSNAHHRIVSVEITGGFLKGLTFTLADGLNVVIGGRGSGKSTLLELIRFALGVPSALLAKRAEALIKKNLGTGRVRVHIETKHGVRYVVERAIGGAPQVFTPEGELVGASLERDLFRIDAYSQDEIETVALDRASQLALVDRFAENELREIAAKIARVDRDLAENATEVLALEEEIANLDDQVTEVRTIEEQLKPLQEGNGADALAVKAAHGEKALRDRERRVLAAADASIARLRTDLGALIATSRGAFGELIGADVAKGLNADLFAPVAERLRGAVDALEETATHVGARCDSATTTVRTQSELLAKRHAVQEAAYDTLIAKQHEDEARVTDRSRLQRRHAELAGALPVIETRRRLHANKMQIRAQLLTELGKLRSERFQIRYDIGERLTKTLAPDVRVRVLESEDLSAYEAVLSDALSALMNNRPKTLVEKISPVMPDDLADLVRRRDPAPLVERAQLQKNPQRANQVIDALSPSHRLFAIESAPIDDAVHIEFKHGSLWKDTTEASAGQRSGAILPILLLLADRPLLIDQPEDNVDPDFMCNVILRRVATLKTSRQFYFNAHHANVAVIPEAERVIKMASDGPHGHLVAAGTLDEMKEHIMLLEGGPEAFEQRRERYARK